MVFCVQDDDTELTIHHTPCAREKIYPFTSILLAAYKNMLMAGGGVLGLSMAYGALCEAAGDKWDAEKGIKNVFVDELMRLSLVGLVTASGYETLPLESAYKRELISDEAFEEARSSIVFFTLISKVCSASERAMMLPAMIELYSKAQLTSSVFTEYLASLPTSTAPVTTQVIAS